MMHSIFCTFISVIIGFAIVYVLECWRIHREELELRKIAAKNAKRARQRVKDELYKEYIRNLRCDRELLK